MRVVRRGVYDRYRKVVRTREENERKEGKRELSSPSPFFLSSSFPSTEVHQFPVFRTRSYDISGSLGLTDPSVDGDRRTGCRGRRREARRSGGRSRARESSRRASRSSTRGAVRRTKVGVDEGRDPPVVAIMRKV